MPSFSYKSRSNFVKCGVGCWGAGCRSQDAKKEVRQSLSVLPVFLKPASQSARSEFGFHSNSNPTQVFR